MIIRLRHTFLEQRNRLGTLLSSLSCLLLLLATLFSNARAAGSTHTEPNRNSYLEWMAHTPEANLRVTIALQGGDYFYQQDNLEEARFFYNLAVNEGFLLQESELYAEALVKSADLESDPLIARFRYHDAEEIYAAHKNYAAIATLLERLIWTYDYTIPMELEIIIDRLEEALTLKRKEKNTTDISETMRTLAWFYEVARNTDAAEKLYQEAVTLDIARLGFDDIRSVLALERFALFYIDYQNYPAAQRELERKLALHQKTEYPDIYNIGRTQSMLGWVYLQQNEFDLAERYYIAALKNINQSITKDPDEPHYYSLPALFDLVYFYITQNQMAIADHYFTIAHEILAQAGEEDAMTYLNSINLEEGGEIDSIIGGFPWSLNAQIIGVQTMLRYRERQ